MLWVMMQIMLSHDADDGPGGHDHVRYADGDDVGDADAGAPGHDDGVDTNSHADDDDAAGNYHS